MSEWSVPGYTGLKVLGSGGFGEVVLARHDASGVLVAIKYLHQSLLADPGFVGVFRGEAAVLASLEDPNIVRLYEYFESPSGAAIVMELVNGVSLKEIIDDQGATVPEAALVVLQGSLLGLAAAHQRGVVHRDYKPGNVLVNSDGVSKLTDFGIAARTGARPEAAGSPLYVAPEQMAGAPASPAGDVYSATATFYECLVGQPPFDGNQAALLYQHYAAPVPLDAVPVPLRPLVSAGMAKDPRHRPADAAAFVTELRTAAFAAYGKDWEKRGRSRLAEAALLLALLWPSNGASAVQGANTQWVNLTPNPQKPKNHRKPKRTQESRESLHRLHLWHLKHLLHLQYLRRHGKKTAVVAAAAVVAALGGIALAGGFHGSSQPPISPTSASTPLVTGISPASGSAGGGTAVTISGTGLSGTTKVSFGGAVAKIVADPPTQITVMSPPGKGTVHITVTTPSGRDTSVGIFTYVSSTTPAARPAISGISPDTGNATGGTAVTITGTGLAAATGVSFGDTAGLITADSGTELTVVSPPVASAGAVDVTVTTSAGASAVTAADEFTYRAPSSPSSEGSSKAAQTIGFTANPPNGVIGGKYDVAATSTSGEPVQFSIASPSAGVCALSGTDTVTFTAAGSCVIDANQAGNAQYQRAPQAQQTVTVSDRSSDLPQTIHFTSSAPDGVVGNTYTVTATGGGSGEQVIFSADASSAGACSVSGDTVAFEAKGTCVIDANQAGNAQYLTAQQAQQQVRVTGLPQTLSITSSPPKGAVVNGSYDLTVTASSGLPVAFSIDASSTEMCSVAGATVTFEARGICVIDANQAGNAQYQPAQQAQQRVNVIGLTQTITFTSIPGESDPRVDGIYDPVAAASSGLPVTYGIDPSSDPGVCSAADGRVTFKARGTCVIDANQAGNAQYQPATQTQQVTVVGIPQGISFDPSPPTEADVDGSYDLTATVDSSAGASGLPVTFTVDAKSASGVCSLSAATVTSPATVTFSKAGTCIIDANQGGSAQYAPAPQVQATITVVAGNRDG